MLKRMTETAIRGFAAVNARISIAARNVAGVLLFCMTLIVLLQVFFRYVLNDSLSWSEEVAKIMMVWSAFLVAPWAYRMGSNVSIDMFAEALPRRARLALTVFLNLLVLWIVWVFLFESLGFWERGLSIKAATMPVQMAWFYSVVPFGFAALLLVGCELLLRNVLNFADPDNDYSVPGSGEIAEGE